MKHLTAEEARKLMPSNSDAEFDKIMGEIAKEAAADHGVLHVYHDLSQTTLVKLTNAGYHVFDHPSISLQKDNLYYSIYWNNYPIG